MRASMMLDLYGIPRDAPGFDTALEGVARAEAVMRAIAERFNDPRFIPYLQIHEFEALVFAAVDHLAVAGVDGPTRAALAAEALPFASPEEIDDGRETAPSRRIKARVPFYDKVLHGAEVTDACGLATLRARCPRFRAWLARLEGAWT